MSGYRLRVGDEYPLHRGQTCSICIWDRFLITMLITSRSGSVGLDTFFSGWGFVITRIAVGVRSDP